ncbi:hypothetical protein AB0K14_35395 [Actinosynnema sp. NPDC050801]|uniref:hypothetical protein n=1 Tax=unclassified Actinosynnema TaxID=2637065 RepID=UPI003406DEE0
MSTPKPVPVLTDLSEVEDHVVAAALRGVAVVCGDLDVDELAASEDPRHLVRAELIRELLLGRRGDLDPRGVRVTGARVVGSLGLDHVKAGAGLSLVRCAFTEPITANDARLPHLVLSGSLVPRLEAWGLRTESNLHLDGVITRGNTASALINMPDAHVGGGADLSRANITNSGGTAVEMSGLHTDNNLVMRGATIAGTGHLGAIRLLSAQIGDEAILDDATVTNAAGPALCADFLRTGGSLVLRKAVLHSGDSALRLPGAVIKGRLLCAGLTVTGSTGASLVLSGAQVDQPLSLPVTAICPHPDRPRCDATGLLHLDGFAFTDLGSADWRQWLHLVRWHTPAYRPQPYQQLAAVERAAGHENNAREILMAQQDDLRRRNPEALGGPAARLAHRLWGWLGGYGYRTRNTALALVTALFLVGALGFWAGHWVTGPGHHAVERANGSGTPCSTLEQIGVGIDRGLPLAPAGVRSKCDLDTTTTAGQWFTAAIWLLQACVWVLATLAIAGYTGLIRKPA